MRSHELALGRTLGLAFEHGDDFYAAIDHFCRDNDVRQGYIPMFLAGFTEADLVNTCEKLTDAAAPVWSRVHLTNAEALGCGTLAYDDVTDTVLPHVHVAVGLKEHSATAHASHLLSARVQFLTEMLPVEVTSPRMCRLPDSDLYDVPLLHFGSQG